MIPHYYIFSAFQPCFFWQIRNRLSFIKYTKYVKSFSFCGTQGKKF